MLVKHIAQIHEKTLKQVNQAINMNRSRFKDNVDILDLKTGQSNLPVLETFINSGVFTKAQVGNASNIYLLSERGYAKLIKIFDDDKSWELYDQLLDEYFELRDGNVEPLHKNLSPAELLDKI